jgi:hypothetical protein
MKAKTLIVCAITASALPVASASAQNAQPSGPQGTQFYGNRAIVMTFSQLDVNRDDVITRDEYSAAVERARVGVGVYQGHSADTNPPAPAP